MSLARRHRESVLAAKSETAAAPLEASGLATNSTAPASASAARPSLARASRDRALAEASATVQRAVAPESDTGTPEERATAQINLRLQVDLRRLRDIQSLEKKIEAKREMLPHYAAWVEGLVTAGVAVEEDVLPTVMIWRIDTGDFDGALVLVEHVLTHSVPLPARYERTAAAFVTEEIATAALKAQQAGQNFPFHILARVAELTAKTDMHDQIRAKLMKAIGVEHMCGAEDETGEPLARAAAAALALESFRRAQQLDERVGVKDRVRRLEKLLALPKETPAQSG